jgi:uncharacterized protein involved in exopolysaccharide biosynthesis
VVTETVQPSDDGIDVLALWRLISSARYLILLITVLCTSIAAYLGFTATFIYRAEAVITPVRGGGINGAGAGGQLGGLAGIASLAGFDIDTGNGADREAKAVLQSRTLIAEFIQQHDLTEQLLEGYRKPWTMWKAVKSFKEDVVTVRDDKRTNLTTVSIDWKNATIAADWANAFVALANQRIRARAIDQATRNIAYLNKQIAQTSAVEVQRALYSLIESETKTLMLANARVEYAFTTIDAAVAPERQLRPRRSLYLLFGFIGGSFLGLLLAYVRAWLAKLRAA